MASKSRAAQRAGIATVDPIWAELRSLPEFQRIRGKAVACHDRFRRMVESQT